MCLLQLAMDIEQMVAQQQILIGQIRSELTSQRRTFEKELASQRQSFRTELTSQASVIQSLVTEMKELRESAKTERQSEFRYDHAPYT